MIPFQPPLETKIYLADGERGLLFSHDERSDIEDPVFKYMAKDLKKMGVTVVMFKLPFKVEGRRRPDPPSVLDEVFKVAWNWVREQPDLRDKKWAIGGHGISAAAAIRASSLLDEIPPIIAISYPMYPANRPENMDISELYAIMGPVLFVAGDDDNRGSYDRLYNQVTMLVPNAELKRIKGGDHNLTVRGRKEGQIASWIASDINRFLLKNLQPC